MDFTAVIIVSSFFATIVLSLYFYFSARNKERMALIEKGLIHEKPKTNRDKNAGMKVGLFLIGLSLGLFMGYILSEYTSVIDVVSYFSMILLFGGVSLILSNFIPAKRELDKENG